jgi:REP element-mobilizing transposase RayT
MLYDPHKHHRRSIRLKKYDYSQAGAYYVTLVAQNRDCLFGEVINDEMQLNEAGRMMHEIWESLPTRFASIELDEYIVMPNHIHGIIVINEVVEDIVGATVGATLVVARPDDLVVQNKNKAGTSTAREDRASPAPTNVNGVNDVGATTVGATLVVAHSDDDLVAQNKNKAGTSPAPTKRVILGDVVGAFKSITTVEYIRGVHEKQWPSFFKRLWQRNYYEHIIRHEESLANIRQYIMDNPRQWALDEENNLRQPH